MASLESKIDFDEAIKEIHILLESAVANESELIKYATYNKAAIVLLCGKFESFLESFLEEYAFEQLKKSNSKNLNNYIAEHVIDVLLNNLDIIKNNKIKRREVIDSLIKLCGPEESDCADFKINSSFNYGKHGQKEVMRLLTCFGFENFANEESAQHFFEKFNSLNNIRNNILHQDSTPSLTHNDVGDYLALISEFVINLDSIAQVFLEEPILE